MIPRVLSTTPLLSLHFTSCPVSFVLSTFNKFVFLLIPTKSSTTQSIFIFYFFLASKGNCIKRKSIHDVYKATKVRVHKNKSCAYSLSQGSYDLTPYFCSFWCSLGFTQFYQGNHSWLEQHLCWKEKKIGVECNPFMFILDFMEGKK